MNKEIGLLHHDAIAVDGQNQNQWYEYLAMSGYGLSSGSATHAASTLPDHRATKLVNGTINSQTWVRVLQSKAG